MSNPFKIESLMSARRVMSPQLVGDRLFFLSDLSGRMSLYAMDRGGSVPEPLLPPDVALQNPILMNGYSFYVYPGLGKILVMIDRDGDENYQPCFVPVDGGIPEPVFGDRFQGQQVNCHHCDLERNLAFLHIDPRTSPLNQAYLVNLSSFKAHRYVGVTMGAKNHFGTIRADGSDGRPSSNAPAATSATSSSPPF